MNTRNRLPDQMPMSAMTTAPTMPVTTANFSDR